MNSATQVRSSWRERTAVRSLLRLSSVSMSKLSRPRYLRLGHGVGGLELVHSRYGPVRKIYRTCSSERTANDEHHHPYEQAQDRRPVPTRVDRLGASYGILWASPPGPQAHALVRCAMAKTLPQLFAFRSRSLPAEFLVDYAPSGRAKCKGGCKENIEDVHALRCHAACSVTPVLLPEMCTQD